MSFANRDSLTTSFPIYIPFNSSSCLIAPTRNSKTMLNKSGKSGHPCLVHDFRGNCLSFSPFNMILAIGLLYVAFIWLRYSASIIIFIRAFIRKGCRIYQRLFLLLFRSSCSFCPFFLLICCITFNDLCVLNHPASL
jgi:hypothetical protein